MIFKKIKKWYMDKFVYPARARAYEKKPKNFRFTVHHDRYAEARDQEFTAILYWGNEIRPGDFIKFFAKSSIGDDFDVWKYKVIKVEDFLVQSATDYQTQQLGFLSREYLIKAIGIYWVGKIVHFEKI